MSKRSEKEARDNDHVWDRLLPVLAVALTISYFQYRKIRRRYLANPDVRCIVDLGAHTPLLALNTVGIVTILGGLWTLTSWSMHDHRGYLPVVAVAAVLGWFLIGLMLNGLAGCWLGIVVDYQSGKVSFPTLYPAITTVPLAEIERMTREDGNKLHIIGGFGSYTLTFTNKRLRDECLHLLSNGTSSRLLRKAD